MGERLPVKWWAIRLRHLDIHVGTKMYFGSVNKESSKCPDILVSLARFAHKKSGACRDDTLLFHATRLSVLEIGELKSRL